MVGLGVPGNYPLIELPWLLEMTPLRLVWFCFFLRKLQRNALGIQKFTETENGFMEAKDYAFRRWLNSPIIIWEYDWMPMVGSLLFFWEAQAIFLIRQKNTVHRKLSTRSSSEHLKLKARWWFQIYIFYFHPKIGKMIQFDFCIFFRGVVQPPTRKSVKNSKSTQNSSFWGIPSLKLTVRPWK